MEAPAVVIVPTADRPGPLDAALSSIAPQARAAGADLLVVDDGEASGDRRDRRTPRRALRAE
ncbi:MAG: hypothetical protein V9E83_12850 [Baekduia sp.]